MAPSRAGSMYSKQHLLRDSISLEGPDESAARSQLPHEEEDGYHCPPSQKRRWSQFLDSLGLMSLRQRHTHLYEPASSDPKVPSKVAYHFNAPRPSTVWVAVKQACVVIPLITLMIMLVLPQDGASVSVTS